MSSTRSLTDSDRALRKALIRRYAAILSLMLAYYFIRTHTQFRIRCPFRAVTGYKCPGCGVSGMLLHLTHAELHAAFMSNMVLFVLLPVLVLSAAVKVVFLPGALMPESRFYKASVAIMIAVLLIFGVLRNIFGY